MLKQGREGGRVLNLTARLFCKGKKEPLIEILMEEKILLLLLVMISGLCWYILYVVWSSSEDSRDILYGWSSLCAILVIAPYALVAFLHNIKTLQDVKLVVALTIIIFSVIIFLSPSLSKDYNAFPNIVEKALQISKLGGGIPVVVNGTDSKATLITGQLIFYDGVTAWIYSVDEIIEAKVKSIIHSNDYDIDINKLKQADVMPYKEMEKTLKISLPESVHYLIVYGSGKGSNSDFHPDTDLIVSAPEVKKEDWLQFKESLIKILPMKRPHILQWELLNTAQKREVCRTGRILFKKKNEI